MKNGQSILKLLACVFMLTAAILIIVGVVSGVLVTGAGLYAVINCFIGLIFFAVGLICFFIYRSISGKKRKLLEAGKYVYATVIDIDVNPYQQIQVDRIAMHPFYILCRYVDKNGKEYTFKSNPLLYNPSGLMQSVQLKVYVDLSKPSHYYVDTNEILPETAVLHKFKYDSNRNAERLISAGKYITAVTCGVELVGRITISGMVKPGFLRIPENICRQFGISMDERGRTFLGYTILCKFTAPDGTIHIFASKGIRGEPDAQHIGELVKVYYEGKNYRNYHVDI